MKSTDHLPTFRKKKRRRRLLRLLAYTSPVMALLCLVTAVYIASYMDRLQQRQQQDSHESQGTVIHAGQNKGDSLKELIEESQLVLPVDDTTDIYVTPRMAYTLEVYDARTDELTSGQEPIPNAMYGLNRQELEQYLMELAALENESLTDVQYHYEVRVFARKAFTVRRTITEKNPEYALFLIAEEGYVIAYTGDRTQIYEFTHIPLGDFPLAQQAMLTRGIYMKTLADYYDFLETYSS